MAEDVPLALITQDIPRVRRALCKEGVKTKDPLPAADHSPTGGDTENASGWPRLGDHFLIPFPFSI